MKYRTSECSMPAMRSSVDKAIAVEGVFPFIFRKKSQAKGLEGKEEIKMLQ